MCRVLHIRTSKMAHLIFGERGYYMLLRYDQVVLLVMQTMTRMVMNL